MQFHLRGDMMIKLNAGAIGIISGRERNGHRWFFFVGVVEKQNLLAIQPSREKRIPKLPDGLANPADGEQMINEGHAKLFHADDLGGFTRTTEAELQSVARFLAKELFAQW